MIFVSMMEVDYQDEEERPKIRQLAETLEFERLDNDGCDYNKDAEGDDNITRPHHHL